MDELLSPAAAPDESGAQFATVGEVLDDGVTLIFDGQDEATDKHYRCNASVLLLPGDRVKVCKDSGTYVVEYVVGSPALRLLIPPGGPFGQYLGKNGTKNYALKWASAPVSDTIKAGNNNFLTLNSNRQLEPSGASSYISYSIGSPSAPFWSAYFGGGTLSLGAKDAKIGFWGTTPLARCALSTTSQNMGYSSASASNYLTVLNNLVGILKKYGLIT